MLSGFKKYLMRQLISLDQITNTLFNGEPDETISSRWGRDVRDALEVGHLPGFFPRWGCYFLERIDPGHCSQSIEFKPDGSPDPHHLVPGAEKK